MNVQLQLRSMPPVYVVKMIMGNELTNTWYFSFHMPQNSHRPFRRTPINRDSYLGLGPCNMRERVFQIFQGSCLTFYDVPFTERDQ